MSAAGPVALVVLLQARSALWAFLRLVRGPRVLAGTPGLRFAKVLGSGRGGGFGLVPSSTHGGLFCAFDDLASARAFIEHSPVLASWRRHAHELALLLLQPVSSRGSWSGHQLAVPTPAAGRGSAEAPGATTVGGGPVVALTRGSVRPSRAYSFWRHAAPAQAAVDGAPGCRLAAGLGEAPLLRQATISVWDSVEAMDAYARRGAHQAAIQAAARGGHFSEAMFVRFVPIEMQGRWRGQALA